VSRGTFLYVALFVTLAYAAALTCGFVIAHVDPQLFDTFKGLLPLIVALPAAILTFAFQQRSSTVVEARAVFKDVSDACKKARQYVSTRPLDAAQKHAVAAELCAARFRILSLYKDRVASRARTPYKMLDELLRALESDKADTARVDESWDELRKLLAMESDRISTWYVFTSGTSEKQRSPSPR
jgi:hypothetical protein